MPQPQPLLLQYQHTGYILSEPVTHQINTNDQERPAAFGPHTIYNVTFTCGKKHIGLTKGHSNARVKGHLHNTTEFKRHHNGRYFSTCIWVNGTDTVTHSIMKAYFIRKLAPSLNHRKEIY